jgi:ATP-binding protein involved in chromosome partitioning
VAANLAVSLGRMGAKVGLLDADIYGPSIPTMFDLNGARPQAREEDGKTILVPIEKYGIKMLSIGFFVDPNKALIWRGPMASGYLQQMLTGGEWGELDYLILDMPPGTGDIHLTLVQSVPVTGAAIVTTPQEVALADARKAYGMFATDKIQVPVLGLIENMAWFTPAELPSNKYYIFGKEGGKKYAEEIGIPLLGQIPLVQGICEAGDSGSPVAMDDDSPVSRAFHDLAEAIVRQIAVRNANLEPTKVVAVN